jgi:hypothetical protein
MTRNAPPSKGLPCIDIPLDWSPEQALAVNELLEELGTQLEELRTRIWLLYGSQMQEFLRADRARTIRPVGDSDDAF